MAYEDTYQEEAVTPLTPLDAQNKAMLNAFATASGPSPSAFGNMAVDPRMYQITESGTPWDIIRGGLRERDYRTDVADAKANKAKYEEAVKQHALSTLQAKQEAELVKRRENVSQTVDFFQRNGLIKPSDVDPIIKAGMAGGDVNKMIDMILKDRDSKNPKNKVVVNVGGQQTTPFSEEVGKKAAGSFIEEKDKAESAVRSINTNAEARRFLNSGIVSGSGAEFILGSGKVLEQLGIPLGKKTEDTLHNTQAYAASMGRQVGEIIKLFGSGTGLSDADRAYAQKIAAGEISLDAEALSKLIEINDQVNIHTLDQYNKRAKQVDEQTGKVSGIPYSTQIAVPKIERYEKPPKEVLSTLREGLVTKFKNGQSWTMTNGQPTRVQ